MHGVTDHHIPHQRATRGAQVVKEPAHDAHHNHHQCHTQTNRGDGDEWNDPRGEIAANKELGVDGQGAES